jgi:arylsulfatase A-like enzyme
MKPIFIVLVSVAFTAAGAAPVSLVNPDFQASGDNSNPAGWTVTETNAGNISSVYVYGGASNVLAFWGAGATAQQSFSPLEITADSQGFFTISFDSGWRGFNLPTATGFQIEFALVNVTEDTVLGTTIYQFPLPSAAITNTYTPVATGNRLFISYDSTQPGLEGDTLALRITATGTPNQGADNFLNTGWIDRISVTAEAREPAAHWSFDPPDRLAEAYGRTPLALAETNGSSSWSTRTGFGDVLANGINTPYLTAANQAALDPGNGDFSLSLWLRRTSGESSLAGLIDALSGSAVSGYQLFFQSNNTLRLRLDDTLGNTVSADTSASQFSLNNWRNLIVTVDRTTDRARFYVDGTEVAPIGGVNIAALTGAITPDQNLFIGNFNGTNAAKGQLDDVAFFKRLLTPAEIAAINANGGTPVKTLFPPAVPIPSVVTSPASATILRGNQTVTLTSAPGAVIRYTLDGSDPGTDSPVYRTTLDLTSTTTLKARVSDGTRLGAITTATYLRIPENPPNVLMIVGDDFGFNDLECYGGVSAATPRLTALAGEGQRFTQFTTTGPGDAVSQYALLTARLAKRGGLSPLIQPNSSGIDSREWTLAEAFRKSGFHTAFIGSWQLGDQPGSRPNDQGFALFHGLPWASSITPAPPLMENGNIVNPSPANVLEALTTKAESEIASQAADPFFILFQPPSLPVTGTSLLGTYGDWIEAIDAATGRLIDQLQSSGASNSTLVIFLSDGGANRNVATYPSGSNGQLRDGKGSTWEGGVRGPLIVRWPGVIPAGDNQAVLWLPDLPLTLVNILDGYQPADRPLDGTARPDVLLGVRTRPDDGTQLFLHRHTGVSCELQAVRSGPWKLHLGAINTDPGNAAPTTTPLLFDLLVDPTEHVNRAATNANVLASLQQAAAAHQASFTSPVPQLPPARGAFLGPVESSTARLTETTATFTFTRPKDSLNDHYILQTGNNLTGWTDLAIDPYVTVTAGTQPGDENVEVSVPMEILGGASPRFFVRLKAVRP